MTADIDISHFDLETEIKELKLKLDQAEITDKEKIAGQLSDLMKQRRNKNRGVLPFRFPLHQLDKSAPLTSGGAKED